MPCESHASRALGRREFFTRSVKNSRLNAYKVFLYTMLSGARQAGQDGKGLSCMIKRTDVAGALKVNLRV
jgi:hypothetical protein